jgi:ABC-type multidrug transport system permease subunit
MRRSHYLLSFMFSRYFFLTIEVTAILGFSALVFDVPVRGSILAIAVTIWIGGTVFSGLGLLVAARPSTIEGVSGLMNFVMLPMWLLSGTFFASDRFPAAFQPFIKVLPLTAFNDALRAVVNEGATLPMVAVPLAILAVWAVVSFAVALKLFRWQ